MHSLIFAHVILDFLSTQTVVWETVNFLMVKITSHELQNCDSTSVCCRCATSVSSVGIIQIISYTHTDWHIPAVAQQRDVSCIMWFFIHRCHTSVLSVAVCGSSLKTIWDTVYDRTAATYKREGQSSILQGNLQGSMD